MGKIIWSWDAEKLQDGYPHWFVLAANLVHNRLYDVLSNPYIVDVCAQSDEDIEFTDFNDCLKEACAYKFAGHAQYEIGFTSKLPFVDAGEVDRLTAERNEYPNKHGFLLNVRDFASIDIYTQLLMNWDVFAHYTFAHRAKIVAAAKKRRVHN